MSRNLNPKHHMPDGWRCLSLKQVAEIQTGLAKGKKNIRNPIECPYIRVANVQDGHLDLTEIKTITVSANEVERYSIRFGDVLMTEGGDFDKLGRGYVWEDQLKNCLHQNHIFVVRTDRKRLDPFFLSYQAGSSYGKSYFLSCSKHSTNLASINSQQLKEYPVLLPSLHDQREIIQIIQAWDRAIILVEGLITAKLERRSWLMQQLLTGNRRLSGFIGRWKSVQIGDALREIARPVEMHNNELYELASVRRNWGGLFVRERLYGRNIKTKNLHEIKENDFLISHIQAAYGSLALVPKEYDGFKISDLYTCLIPRNSDEFDIRFFAYLAQQPKMTYLARVSSNGFFAERLRLNFKIESFLNQEIRIPPTIQEQQAIIQILHDVDREIDLLVAQLDALKEQKKGLMQQLLTGRIRVPV